MLGCSEGVEMDKTRMRHVQFIFHDAQCADLPDLIEFVHETKRPLLDFWNPGNAIEWLLEGDPGIAVTPLAAERAHCSHLVGDEFGVRQLRNANAITATVVLPAMVGTSENAVAHFAQRQARGAMATAILQCGRSAFAIEEQRQRLAEKLNSLR